MLRFTRIFSGKFQYLGNCAGVKHLTNIMSGWTPKAKGNLKGLTNRLKMDFQ